MKRVAYIVLALGLAVPVFAGQRGFAPGHGQVAGNYGFGFGNVVFPAGPRNVGSITNPGFAHSLGGIVSGLRPYTGAPRLGRGHGHFIRRAPIFVPVTYPIFIGGYAEPEPAPNVTIINNIPPQAPPVIINQVFPSQGAKPTTEEYAPSSDDASESSGVAVYQAPSAQPAANSATEPKPTIYLIAFKDGSIQTSLGYWVEGDTLQYITPRGTINKASLELVDRQLSQQLNKERDLEFHLPSGG